MDTLGSLRSLHLSPYPNIDHFNIPDIIDNIYNLRDLWIEAPIESKQSLDISDASIGGGLPTVKRSISTNLGEEMSGDLPLKLRTITFSGTGFTQIHDNVFSVNIPYFHVYTKNDFLTFYYFSFREFNHLIYI